MLLLVVKKIGATVRGSMYNFGEVCADNLPREGAILAVNWNFGTNIAVAADGNSLDDIQKKGFVKCLQDSSALPSKRSGLRHSLDHPQTRRNFDDSPFDLGFMTPMEEYLRFQNAAKGPKFPASIQWSFHYADQLWLKHLSDLHILSPYAEVLGI
ncbi:hypothetical protein BDV96DRAFT_582840 [Lophiotrema nucula]|uniref:Uncharacterized protein n=1 Tax=Lophiotrema nucula TaxID=690887 RepID=A0A6A5YYW2_9PLEO|nr:hypothetical protein BDV96DRAFT_582840 [Lophiotrema nucula]